MAQEKHEAVHRLGTMLASQFTDNELAKLAKFRDRVYQQEKYLKRVLDEKHLRFARYLREMGAINEEA